MENISKEINILFTSAGRRSYLLKYFKDALNGIGKIHAANSSENAPAFAVADYSVTSPYIYDEKYIPFLVEYCKKYSISVIISLFDVDLPILAKNREKFEQIGVRVIVSKEEVLSVCNDKWNTYNYLKSNGFNVPKTYIDLQEVFDAIKNNEINYPLIIKPRWGMGSIAVYEADNVEEMKILYEKVKKQIKNSYLKYESMENIESSVIIQEKMVGQEYGLDVICDLQGEYITTIVKEKIAMRSGETDCAKVVENCGLKECGRRLAEKLGHIANLDVDAFCRGDKVYILEMNARFGGGYPFSHIAGVNLPLAIIKWIQNEEIEASLLSPKIGIVGYKDISIKLINSN